MPGIDATRLQIYRARRHQVSQSPGLEFKGSLGTLYFDNLKVIPK